MMTPGLLQNYSTAHTTHMLGQPQLAQPPSLGAYHQQPMLATSQILAQQPMAQSIPEFTFNPATPSPMIGDMQQAGPTFSTLLRDATALAEMSMVDPNSLQGGLQPTSHQPAQKTLSAIVRELVNDDSIIPPSTHPSNNTGLHF
jgi:hypothetical protein